MSDRVNRITGHVKISQTSAVKKSSDDDVVIVWSKRTAISKAKKGQFKDSGSVEMLAPVLRALVEETKIDPKIIGDLVVGNVLGAGAIRATEVRQAAFIAGYPEKVPVRTVNRQCSSGLQAIADVAAAIKAGFYECGIGAGVETMSKDPFGWSGTVSEEVKANVPSANCLIPMGMTSENVASKYYISRKAQDELAVSSHKKAAKAQKEGKFKQEIVPIQVKWKDSATGAVKKILVDSDDGIREDTSLESLSKLNAVFKKNGSTTAGNASQVSDGAAATLLMKRSLARKLNLPILGVFRSFAAVGVPPEIMGVGPGYAIPEALRLAGVSANDIDLYEINEAFASQAYWSVNYLGIPWEKVNVNGGAIALGHPLGMTGSRMTSTLLAELHKRKKRYGVVSMCIGSGMGAAAVFERE
jgi:acetyl-CoA acyltransferase 1